MAHSGDRIAKQYVLLKELGHSATSQVFLAQDERTREQVTLKFTEKSKVYETLQRLDHPNVLRVIGFGEDEKNGFYMVSEYLKGDVLNQIVPKDEGLSLSEAWPILVEIFAGVSALHKEGLLHLDLKPSNIFITRDEEGNECVKIIDFSIAQAISDPAHRVLGTPGYVAVELVQKSEKPSIQSDIYGLGALLSFLMNGRRPFAGDSNEAILENQVRGAIFAGKEPMQSVIKRATALLPRDRFKSVEQMSDALSVIHREQMMVKESPEEGPSEKIADTSLGRMVLVTIVVTLLTTTLMLYYWLISGS